MYNDFGRDYYLKMMGLNADQIPDTLLLHGVMDVGRHMPRWRQCFEAAIDTPFTNMFIGKRGGRSCAFAAVYGGPAAATAVHIFASLGSKRVILVGTCGGLDPQLPVGQFVLLDSVVHEDGTVRHYQPGAAQTRSTPSLTDRLSAALAERGAAVTYGLGVSTDSALAETPEDVRRWQGMGCAAVDMEASTVFAAAAHFGLERAAALYVLDPIGAGRDTSSLTEREHAARKQARSIQTEAAIALALGTYPEHKA
jgi:uridine phosphorylase